MKQMISAFGLCQINAWLLSAWGHFLIHDLHLMYHHESVSNGMLHRNYLHSYYDYSYLKYILCVKCVHQSADGSGSKRPLGVSRSSYLTCCYCTTHILYPAFCLCHISHFTLINKSHKYAVSYFLSTQELICVMKSKMRDGAK